MVIAALAIYWLALFIGTHRPPGNEPLPVDVSDKTLHYTAYAGLAFLVSAWSCTARSLTPGRALIILAGVLCYGVFDELTQIPVGRTCDLYDWLADAMGAVSGLLAFVVLRFARR